MHTYNLLKKLSGDTKTEVEGPNSLCAGKKSPLTMLP